MVEHLFCLSSIFANMFQQDKVNTADSAFIFLIILLISQNQ